MDIKAFLKSPTTIHGIAAGVAVAAGFGAYYLTKSIPEAGAVVGGLYSVINIVMPDNSNLPNDVEKMVIDALTAQANKKLAASVPALVADAQSVVGDLLTAKTPPGV